MNCPKCNAEPCEDSKVYGVESEPTMYYRCHMHGWYPPKPDGTKYQGISDGGVKGRLEKLNQGTGYIPYD